MASYAEYLKTNGATDADIQILDTPVARKAYDAMAARATEAERLRAIAETDRTNYQNWYETQALPAYTDMQNKVVTSAAELARAKAAVLAAQEEGLTKIAESLGWKADGTTTPAATATATTPPVDTSKFVTADVLTNFMDQAGTGLAAMEDMVIEHRELFPGQRLNVSELRREAVAAKKNVVQLWMEKYNVPAARQAADDKAKATYETKLREEGAAAERARLGDQFNPNSRPLMPSTSPFTQRADRDRVKQPWEVEDRTTERVMSATRKLMEQSAAPKTN